MKKIIVTAALAITTISAFAQGSFSFGTVARFVWDDWSIQAPRADQSNNVAFLFGTGTPLVNTSTGISGTATNGSSSFNAVSAWTSILTDPNFRLATNSDLGTLAQVQTSTLGTASYLGGASFQVAGSSANGGVTTIYMIAWSYLYANPFLAAAANAPVGWSSPFSYTYAAGPVPGPAGTVGGNFSDAGALPFGVSAVPEPTTFALAGLGAASLLIFRKRKQ